MRVPPLPADEWDDAVDHALSGMLPAERRNPADAGNLLATLVRHPKLTRAFLRFNNHLLFRRRCRRGCASWPCCGWPT